MSDLAPRANRPRLTAIASGKGGVGKTWFAITLAQALAAQGLQVLLVDGDLGLANVDIQLGITPQFDLGSVLAGRATLAQAAMKLDSAGFAVLAGRSGSGALASLAPAALSGILRGLAALPYDHVLLDLGAGVDGSVRRMAAHADTLLVLVTEEPTPLTDAYAVIKLNAADAPQADVRIVVNQASSAAAAQRTYGTIARACTRFLGKTPALAGIIRRDKSVADAIRHQAPLLTRHPSSAASVDVLSIATGLSE